MPPLARGLSLREVAQAPDQVVERLLEVVGGIALGARVVVVVDEDPRVGQVGVVELRGEGDQHLVAFDEDTLEDLAHGLGRGRIDLELGGFEPPAPLAQVEEREHQDSSATPGCSVVSAGATTGRLRDHTIQPETPTATRGDREGHQ